MQPSPRTSVLFGGTGFIGTHLARLLLEQGAEEVVLADLLPPRRAAWPAALTAAERAGRLRYVPVDVRQPLTQDALPARAGLAVNLAAVHREPGPAPREYFETNLRGAEQVCAWAERAECPRLVFTSTIAVYGAAPAPWDESALPMPETPYGISKLVAEQMHRAWCRAAPGRRLLIVRPGVVFGAGEGGNVTRLVRALLRGRFAYVGDGRTPKAGGYVKELCLAMQWALARMEAGREAQALLNFTLDPAPTVRDYVEAIARVAGRRRPVLRLPYPLLLAGAALLEALARPVGRHGPIHPAHVRKLRRGNPARADWLRQAGYPFRYPLEEALRDWQAERPQDWRVP